MSFQTAFLEPFARAARAGIISFQFLDQFLVTVNHAVAALDLGLAVENPSGACS